MISLRSLLGRAPLLGGFLVASSVLHAQPTFRAAHPDAADGTTAGTSGLAGTVADLFRFGDCAQPLCLPVAAGQHGNHFIPSLVQGQSNLLTFITNSIGSSVSNLPIAGTSSGALFRFENGRPVRENVSAGPIYAERARTIGRGRLFVGANLSGFDFQSLRGVPLDALVFNFTHVNVGDPALGEPAFENDIIQVTADLNVSVLVTTLAANYGLLDRLDVGLALPIVRTSVSGHSTAQVIPFGPDSPHVFGTTDNPSYTAKAQAFGSAFGIGDLAARAKARIVEGERGDFAVVGEVRFPTGDEADLLGSGSLAWRAIGVASARFGDFSPHANLGYLSRSSDQQNDAVLATLGFDHLLSPFATLAVDVLSRWQLGDSKITLPQPTQLQVPYVRTVNPSNLPERRDNALDASIGTRLVTGEGITFLLNALVPVTRAGGLQPSVAWTAGLEYTF